MRYEIMQPGAFAFLKVQLEAGESIKAESDAMMAMSGNIKVEGKMEGGMLGGFPVLWNFPVIVTTSTRITIVFSIAFSSISNGISV